jgi:RNA polymerase sigma-70 factor (ECF subfamily)
MTDADAFPALDAALADDGFVRALARRVVRDAAEADDLAQDAWLEALRRRPQARPSLRAWFATVVAHLARNRARGDRRRDDRERRGARPEGVDPESALLEREEVRRKLVRAVVALGKPQSTVLTLRFFEDLPPRRIAEKLGLPVETVRTHLKRGVARLRESLSDDRTADGRTALALLPVLLPRHDFAAALAGAALVTAKAKVAASALVVAAVVGGFYAVSRPAPELAAPTPAPAASRAAPPPAEKPVDASARAASSPVAREEFRDAAESAPSSAPVAKAGGGCVVRGRVLDVDGVPVPDCDVFFSTATGGSELTEESLFDALLSASRWKNLIDAARAGDGTRQTRTDAEGAFVFANLPVTDGAFVGAADARRGVAQAPGIATAADRPREVALKFPGGCAVFGVVRDERGDPVAGERVSVAGTRADGVQAYVLGATTDPKGAYRTPPIARTDLRATIQREGYRYASNSTGTLKPDDREKRLDFDLALAPRMSGRIVLAGGAAANLAARLKESGLAGHDALLGLYGSHDDPATAPNFLDIGRDGGECDAANDAWTLVPSGDPSKYVSLWVGRTLVAVAESGGKTEFDLVLDPAKLPQPSPRGRLVVRVVDADGRAVKDASVEFEPRYGFTRRGRRPGFAAREPGIFVCEGLPLREMVVAVKAPGFGATAAGVDVLPPPATTEATVVLRPATSRLVVTAKQPDGSPLAGGEAYLLGADGLPLPDVWPTKLNADGRATFEKLAPGDYVVCAEPPLETLAGVGRRVRVSGDESTIALELPTGVEVIVDPEGTGGPFSFRFFAEDGTPLSDARANGAQAYCDNTRVRLPPGRVTVEIECPDFESATATFEAKEGARVPVKMTPRK